MKEWEVQVRRHGPVFAFALAGALVLGFVSAVMRNETTQMFFMFYVMIAWVGMAGYAGVELFRFYYMGADVLLLLAPGSRERMLARLCAVMAGGMLAFFLATLPFSLSNVPAAVRRSDLVVVSYYMISKAVSLAAFFAVASALLVLVKRIGSKLWAAVALVVGWAAFTFAQGYLLLAIARHQWGAVDWALGLNPSIVVVNQYSNLVPMLVLGKHVSTLPASFLPSSVAMNALIAVGGVAVCVAVSRFSRANFIPR